MRRSLRSSLVALLVIVLAGAAGWAARPLSPPVTSPLSAALATVPADATSVGFTDWRRLREGPVGESELGERDLATRSELFDSADVMEDVLGWSVRDLDWELVAQGGAAGEVTLVASLGASTSPRAVREGLEDAGYSGSDGAWRAPGTGAGGLGLSPLLQEVVLLERERLVVMAPTSPTARAVADVARGRAEPVTRDRALLDVAQALSGSDAVILEREALGCSTTALSDTQAQAQAEVALGGADVLEPYVASGRGLSESGGDGFGAQSLTFALRFPDPATARAQLDARLPATSGPFIGRTGEVEESLRLDSATTDQGVVSLRFRHDPTTGVFMTGVGPLLFASC